MVLESKDRVTIVSSLIKHYYIRNAQGDITGLFDKTGTQVVSYTYDSWGKHFPEVKDENGKVLPTSGITGSMADTVGVKNPYRYRGYRYDSETQLYYLQSRYYNPSWGRFINADGIIGQTGELLAHNLFAYCKNNVVNLEDPSGFRPMYAGEETDAMREASFAAMAPVTAKNKASSSKTVVKNKTVDKAIGVATGVLLSSGEEFGEHIDIIVGTIKTPKYFFNFTGVRKVPITIGTLTELCKALGIISFTESINENFSGKYSNGNAWARTAVDIAGFGVTTFALKGSGALLGGAVISAGTEYIKNRYLTN